MQEKVDELNGNSKELLNSPEISYEIISSDFLNSKRGKFVKLLDTDEYKFTLNKMGKVLTFSEPIFIKTISFISSADSIKPVVDAELTFADGKKSGVMKLHDSSKGKNRCFISVNNFVKSIDISSGKMIGSEMISRIIVSGLSPEKFYDLLNELNKFSDHYETFKTDCSSLIDELNKKNSQIDEKEKGFISKKEEFEKSVRELESKVEEKISKLEALTGEIEENEEKLRGIKLTYADIEDKETKVNNSVEELTEKKSSLNRNISNLKDELEGLTRRKDLYSEDMTGFNSESTKQLNVYYGLLGIVLIGLAIIGIYAVTNINFLIDVYTNLKTNRVETSGWDLIIMRAPYATIVLAVISALTLFAKVLIGKILEINSQKRTMIALSILARDINNTSTKGLNLSFEEIAQRREGLKFDLLSESIVGGTFEAVAKKREQRFIEIEKLKLKKDDIAEIEEAPIQ